MIAKFVSIPEFPSFSYGEYVNCYQFLDRIKNAKKDIKSISTNINDKNRQEQLIGEEFKEQIESILSEYSAFGFDYDTIFNHMYNY